MPKLVVTNSEKALILAERHRLALDDVAWEDRPYIDDNDLREMSPHRAYRLIRSGTGQWEYDPLAQRHMNLKHPDNLHLVKARELYELQGREYPFAKK